MDKMREEFNSQFGSKGHISEFFSPGRVNLIGEHIDYNGGCVFPCALTIGTFGLFRKREDRKVRCYSLNFEEIGVIEFTLDQLKLEEKHHWANYVKAMIWAFLKEYKRIEQGFDFLCYGNIPNSSGLSSSASLELLVSKMLMEEYNIDCDMKKAALLSQFAENEFIGVNCGIMDQFAIAMGKKNQAILLNTNTLEYTYTKIDLKDYKIVICNTNKERRLCDSKYNERREECEKALAFIKKEKNINNLAEITPEEFENIKHLIKDDLCLKRAQHVVYENQRTKDTLKALAHNDLILFGKLLIDSHHSLKELYEVTGKELDTLVHISLCQDGVLGARMTGAGFGGCAIAIVKESLIAKFENNVSKKYEEIIGYKPSFYVVSIGDGTRKI